MQLLRKRWRSVLLFGFSALLLSGCGQIVVLNPQGPVAKEELHLITWSFGLMMVVVVAVFVLFAYMLIKYRAKPDNKNDYLPDQDGNRLLETVWTVVPIIIIIALVIPTIKTTYALVKPPSNGTPVVIRAISANWKWMFQYPGQGIETVNYVVIPDNRPVEFQLDAIGPMNSLWIPALGGQEYTMPGMVMRLWLQADHAGTYVGRSANFSGRGFVHMVFNVIAKNPTDYAAWMSKVKSSSPVMTMSDYQKLMAQSVVPTMTFSHYIQSSGSQRNSMSAMSMASSS